MERHLHLMIHHRAGAVRRKDLELLRRPVRTVIDRVLEQFLQIFNQLCFELHHLAIFPQVPPLLDRRMRYCTRVSKLCASFSAITFSAFV